MASFQDNLGKVVPECHTSLRFYCSKVWKVAENSINVPHWDKPRIRMFSALHQLVAFTITSHADEKYIKAITVSIKNKLKQWNIITEILGTLQVCYSITLWIIRQDHLQVTHYSLFSRTACFTELLLNKCPTDLHTIWRHAAITSNNG